MPVHQLNKNKRKPQRFVFKFFREVFYADLKLVFLPDLVIRYYSALQDYGKIKYQKGSQKWNKYLPKST